ncbi:hypothetical protein L1987_52205 [Smallanthus sonchifolius]|uniref:Uncharacterized protein n=1 Tax=Smallanthus sonchifolius TaxID=185202 RepID=A0ACB9ERT7_9ASTR|nr:hypothetical protein L1987_52205 [Smallanthus sonchifolius]
MNNGAEKYVKRKERSLKITPSWAVAVVVFVILAISIGLEYILHLIGHWLQHKQKKSLHEALEKIKAELMLLGFISLLLTVGQEPISDICIPSKVARTWHPCNDDSPDDKFYDPCLKKGKVQMVSNYGIHQLHIFIFVLAVVHVGYCLLTLVLGKLKMRRWKAWEDETRTAEYQYQHGKVAFSDSSSPQSQKLITLPLDMASSIPIVWFFAVLLLLTNTHDWYAYLWLPFIPLIVSSVVYDYEIVVIVGAKLQMIITKMGKRTHDMTDVVKGTPMVQPKRVSTGISLVELGKHLEHKDFRPISFASCGHK